jgi:hypothetical protein
MLTKLVKEGLIRSGLDQKAEYVERAKVELGDIKYLKFESYFLTLQKILEVAEQRTLLGAGRGSGAGSLVNFLLGITHVDPIKYGLLWTRFLNKAKCLDPQHFVLTANGKKRLSDLVIGDKVITGRNREGTITNKSISSHTSIVKLTFGEQIVTCSSTHRWIVVRDSKEIEVLASEILLTDMLVLRSE